MLVTTLLTRQMLPLLVCAGLRISCGQTLAPYLIDTFPAPNATGVPTNVNIVLRARVSLPIPPFATAGYYTLKSQTGPAVPFTSLPNCGCFATVLIPSAPLSPNTLYTFTVQPSADIGNPYSFSFTTGSTADKAPPHLLSVDPPSGSSGLGLNGPFKFLFDKRIARSLQQSQFVTVHALPDYVYAYTPSAALSDDGTTLIVRIGIQQGFPTGYDITIDPAQFVDLFGNAGQGDPMTAHYSTFVAGDSSGPHVKASLPADGDTGVVTNVLPRLVFQKTIDNTTAPKGIELRTGGTAQSISFSLSSDPNTPNSGGVLSIVPSKTLAPNQAYTIVINSGLRDPAGFPVQQPRTIQFTTGSGPDVIAPAVLGSSPPVQAVPPNARVIIRTNKAIAPIVLDRLSTAGLAYGNFNENSVPVSATLSSDGTLLTLIPQSPLPSQFFAVRVSEIVDTSGAPFFSYGSGTAISFSVAGDEDHSTPVLLAVNPPPDSGSVPLSTSIQLRFNKTCATCLFPGAIMVSAPDGSRLTKVAADYGTGNMSFTVNPGSLIPSTTYTVSLIGIVDLAGNAMPDYSFSFTTAAGTTPFSQLKLLDSSVANGDTGVDPSGPFVFHYDAVLNPVYAVTSATIAGPSNFSYPVRSSASGSTLTITPVPPLPANTRFQLALSVTSVLGGSSQTQVTFTTAASDDTTRPQVTGISPGDGTMLPRGNVVFTLTFSKPVNPSTITTDSISLYCAETRLIPALVRAEDNRSVSFTLPNVLVSGFSVIASAGVKDLAGNSLVPFEANYKEPPPGPVGFSMPIREIRPPSGSTGIAANIAITWFLDQPADLAVIQANLLVLADNTPFPGSFDSSDGGRILRFSPANPFPAGALVSFYERTPMLYQNNYYNTTSFTIAPVPDPALRFVRTTLGASAALDSIFEIEFTQDPPLGQTIASLSYSAGHGYSTPIPFTESIPRPHVLRVTTTGPRQAGYYSIALSNKVIGDINAPRYLSCTMSATTVGGMAKVALAGPVAGATGAPLNTTIRVLFGAPINPLTVTAKSAAVSVGGRVLDAQRTFPQNNREILLRTLEALPPNARVDVLLTGLEDLAGRPIPATSWSFTTSADLDFTAPTILSTSLPYYNNGSLEIAANEAVQIVFSEPMDPGLTAQIANSSGFQNDAANVTLSTDLRTLTIAPVGAWAKGQQYNFDLQNVIDLSGNPGSIGGPPIGFQVAFDPSTKPPNLLAISPPDGSTAMPLNARIMAAFDKPVYAPFEGVQLTGSDGNTVQLAREYSNDPNEVVFAPVRALRPNTAYSLSFSGATDMSGNPMSSAATAGFVTGETPDYAGPAASLFILTPLPVNLALRIRFSEPISPATVTAQQIQLLAGTVPQPADLLLSADGLSVTVNPRQPLIPGKSYTLSVVAPADFAGNAVTFGGGSFNGVRSTFVAGDSADNTPPAIAIFPADGTSGFPASVNPVFGLAAPSLSVTFSKPVDLMTNPPVLRVLKDGKPLQGAVTTTATQYTFTPSALNYNATYRIEVSNVVDYIGNAAAPASSTFTTSQSAAADTAAFRVTSIQPADGSAVIANDSPIVVVFTKLLNPAGAVFQVRNSSTVPIYGAWTTNGSTMTFTPTEPWPSAATITVNVFRQFGNVAFRDLTNVLLDKDYTFTFTAAVRPDSTPPALVSITPAPGTPISPINNTFTLVFSKPIIVDTQALQAYIGSQTVSVSVFYNQSAHIINATVFSVTADSVLTLIGTGGMHDDAGNSLTPFSFQYPTLKADESGNPNVSSVSPNNYASAAAPNTPIKIQFNKAMDPDSVLAAVRVTQDGAEIAGQLQMLDSNHSVQFTPNANYKAGSRIDVFVFNTAADLSGTRLSQRYQSFFTVAAGEAPETPQMSVSLTSFGDTVAPGAALDLAFDRELDASAAGPENVWLCAGHTRIPGAVVLRNSRTLRFQPSEPLRIGELYVLTTGPNLRSTDGFSNRPREFRFRVDPRSLDVRLESVEYVRAPSSFAVRIRFTGPVSAISADGLKLLAPDGSAVHASARFSTDGREWLLDLPAPTAVRVVLDGVEDRWGRKLASESREPVLVR